MTASTCVHDKLAVFLDRLRECHWRIHQIEANYHEPDGFRFALNSFIRAIADVPTMLTRDLERHAAARIAIKPKREVLKDTALYSILKLRRDFIMLRGMLDLSSRGSVVTIEGRKIKFSFPLQVPPWESSDEAYGRFKVICRTNKNVAWFWP